MGCVLLSAIAVLMAHAQTTTQMKMTIEVPPEIEAQGVTLLPALHPDAVKHAERISGRDLASVRGILPFGVVLINNGENRLLTTAVGFRWEDEKGQPHRPIFNISAFTEPEGGQIPKGSARLFVPQRGLNLHFVRQEDDASVNMVEGISGYSDVIVQMQTDLAKLKEVTAFIDSVTIENVGLVGPDIADLRAIYKDRKTTH